MNAVIRIQSVTQLDYHIKHSIQKVPSLYPVHPRQRRFLSAHRCKG